MSSGIPIAENLDVTTLPVTSVLIEVSHDSEMILTNSQNYLKADLPCFSRHIYFVNICLLRASEHLTFHNNSAEFNLPWKIQIHVRYISNICFSRIFIRLTAFPRELGDTDSIHSGQQMLAYLTN